MIFRKKTMINKNITIQLQKNQVVRQTICWFIQPISWEEVKGSLYL